MIYFQVKWSNLPIDLFIIFWFINQSIALFVDQLTDML